MSKDNKDSIPPNNQINMDEERASHAEVLDKFRQKGYKLENLPPLNDDDPLYTAMKNKKRTGKFEFAEELVDNLNRNVLKNSDTKHIKQFNLDKKNINVLKIKTESNFFQKLFLVIIIFMVLIVMLSFYSSTAHSQTTNFNNSPNNWVNSPNNWDNSPNNFNNSPNNFNNSPNNFSATNGVYDNRGNRIGYEVPAPSGVINYFDNNGNRIGYKPTGR